jgi:hypothetical protein
MSKSIKDLERINRKERLLNAIAHCHPFPDAYDLNITQILAEGLKTLDQYPEDPNERGEWTQHVAALCLEAIQRTVMKEVSWPDAIEVPRRLPVPISLIAGYYPSPSDASDSGCVYGGLTLQCDPSRWHWQLVHYTLLEYGGMTHWLPPDVECLPVEVEA